MPSPLVPPLALALVLSLVATARAGETPETGALMDCLVPPCEDSYGSCPVAYFGDLIEALDEVCCREHRVTHSDVEFRVTKSDIGTVESPCVGTTGVPHPGYCTYECAVAYHQFGELCGHVDMFDEFGMDSSYGFSRTSFAQACADALAHPQPNSASWQSCDLADQWHNVVSFARYCDPGVSTALTIDPASVAALGEDFCTSDCYNVLEPWYHNCATAADDPTLAEDSTVEGSTSHTITGDERMMSDTMTAFIPLIQHCETTYGMPPPPPPEYDNDCELESIASVCEGQIPENTNAFCFSPCANYVQQSLKKCRGVVDSQGQSPLAAVVTSCTGYWEGEDEGAMGGGH